VADGWTVIGYDPDITRSAEARGAGVQLVHSTQALAETVSDILASLPSPRAVLDTAEIIARTSAGPRTVIDTSTLALGDKMAFKAILEEAGHAALDCPVSGTGAQAAAKDLVVYASGDSAAIRRLEPMFLGFSRLVHDLGAYGNGSRMKFIANLLVAIHNVAAAEALVLAMKAGLDPHKTVEIIASGAGTSRMFEVRGPMMAANTYLPATMRSSTWKKDLAVIGEFASSLDCPTPLFNVASALYAATLAMGRGDEDSGAVCAMLEMMAGIERKA
jgi:3-hydroxyisobutyrate dehydrogenase-like beta-hydroxyacid dehydrogenase